MLARSSNSSYKSIEFRTMGPAAPFEAIHSPPISTLNLSLHGGLCSGVDFSLRAMVNYIRTTFMNIHHDNISRIGSLKSEHETRSCKPVKQVTFSKHGCLCLLHSHVPRPRRPLESAQASEDRLASSSLFPFCFMITSEMTLSLQTDIDYK